MPAGRGAGAGSSSTTSERYMAALAATLKSCSAQAQTYATCVTAKLPEVEKGSCEREFQTLQQCFTREFAQHRRRP
ncbi:MAG: hypothetical protein J3K34DRAFT_422596 [Monoraphidium minutum]|nr:MAG: hypothetical protein J3K34DRAFT_422596 [Monoraphidium minutum]